MEAVGTLAGGVAHDFNNILTIVLGYAELLIAKTDKKAPDYADLQEIAQAARNGADLVKRLLAFGRKAESKPRPINLNHRVEQLQKVLSRTLPKTIGIQLNLAKDLRTINADPTQMDQILMNLAVNARYAMPDEGQLTIETANVTLDDEYCRFHMGANPGEYVLLAVSDTGHGMDRETLKHIFEPFFTTKDPGQGTGLGLAMVYGIVKQHGGCINCHSEPSKGTTFKIYFPAAVSPEQAQAIETKSPPRGGFETILIVDDEKPVRDLGVRILTNAGYKVFTASNGKEALELYQSRSREISLVLLDLVMPEMGGKQCLQDLLRWDPCAKVVIATGYSPGGATKEILASTAMGYIEKPYDVRQVLEVVRSVLDK
jgi:two-component system, cell cycle sensor histidine kinase and response regulator CckA